jgi:hypothetical protein
MVNARVLGDFREVRFGLIEFTDDVACGRWIGGRLVHPRRESVQALVQFAKTLRGREAGAGE